jgi:predicted O-methyltransferase YrrM
MDFTAEPPLGVWSTDPSCYEFLAANVAGTQRTLETGAGLSTVLLGALAAEHTCVTPSHDEGDRVRAYCRARDIAIPGLHFVIGMSDRVLPTLSGPRDLVLVDGSHGFPTPFIDWYYAGALLVAGGLLVVDDIQLPAVAHLAAVLDDDPRWSGVARSEKWAAWRRVGTGSLAQDWFEQPWLAAPLPRDPLGLARRGAGAVARRTRALVRRR